MGLAWIKMLSNKTFVSRNMCNYPFLWWYEKTIWTFMVWVGEWTELDRGGSATWDIWFVWNQLCADIPHTPSKCSRLDGDDAVFFYSFLRSFRSFFSFSFYSSVERGLKGDAHIYVCVVMYRVTHYCPVSRERTHKSWQPISRSTYEGYHRRCQRLTRPPLRLVKKRQRKNWKDDYADLWTSRRLCYLWRGALIRPGAGSQDRLCRF